MAPSSFDLSGIVQDEYESVGKCRTYQNIVVPMAPVPVQTPPPLMIGSPDMRRTQLLESEVPTPTFQPFPYAPQTPPPTSPTLVDNDTAIAMAVQEEEREPVYLQPADPPIHIPIPILDSRLAQFQHEHPRAYTIDEVVQDLGDLCIKAKVVQLCDALQKQTTLQKQREDIEKQLTQLQHAQFNTDLEVNGIRKRMERADLEEEEDPREEEEEDLPMEEADSQEVDSQEGDSQEEDSQEEDLQVGDHQAEEYHLREHPVINRTNSLEMPHKYLPEID
ncbi:hypothetical protein BJY52DRAFT_1190240 [Lactarius psammicola]|nr:hypothetical protein BJY52DRAFT_1190240 [Lactarius psammicola]